MITGKAGHDYRATGGAVEALNPGAKGGVKAAQESSSHNHGGSITDDFVSEIYRDSRRRGHTSRGAAGRLES